MSPLKLPIQKPCQSPETDKRGWSGQKHPVLFGTTPNTSGVGLSGSQKGERGSFVSMPGAEDSARLPGHWRDVREWSIEKRPSHRMWVQDVEHVLGSTARQLCASLDKYPHHEPGDGSNHFSPSFQDWFPSRHPYLQTAVGPLHPQTEELSHGPHCSAAKMDNSSMKPSSLIDLKCLLV